MDRYQRVEKPRPESAINENEIRITSQGLIRSYISYGTNLLQEKRAKEIVLKAMGQAINKAVALAEILKDRIPGLHQDTSIGSVSITDVWEPIEEGLLPLEMTRHVSMIAISLSTRPINQNSPGYQAPLHVAQQKMQKYQPSQQYQQQHITRQQPAQQYDDSYDRGRGHGRGRGRSWGRGGYGNQGGYGDYGSYGGYQGYGGYGHNQENGGWNNSWNQRGVRSGGRGRGRGSWSYRASRYEQGRGVGGTSYGRGRGRIGGRV